MIDTVPEFELTEEQRELRHEVRTFVEEEIRPLDLNRYEWQADPNARIPWEVIETGTHEYGLMDFTVPERYGGRDIDPLSFVLAVEELAAGDTGLGHLFSYEWKHAKTVDLHAESHVKDAFFERFVGDPHYLVSSAATEPAHGSDHVLDHERYQFETVAERDGEHWVINGTKRFITNASDASVYLVYAQTDPAVPATEGTTLFLVDREFEGVEVSHVHDKIARRLINNATIEFSDVHVPGDRVLGEVNQGRHLARSAYDPVESGTMALGTARRAFEEALAYAHERQQGGSAIIDHQAIANDFADMFAELHATRQLIWLTARSLDQGEYEPAFGAMSNMFASRVAFDVATRAHEKWGGAGIMLDSPAQRYVRNTLLYLHANGTDEVLRERIINALLDRPVGTYRQGCER